MDEQKVVKVAEDMPTVIIPSDVDQLTTEVQLFNLLDEDERATLSANSGNIAAMWENIHQKKAGDTQEQHFDHKHLLCKELSICIL